MAVFIITGAAIFVRELYLYGRFIRYLMEQLLKGDSFQIEIDVRIKKKWKSIDRELIGLGKGSRPIRSAAFQRIFHIAISVIVL